MNCVINGNIPSNFKGNAFLVSNTIFYQTLSPLSIEFKLEQKSQITIMAWGPGGNSGPNKNNFNYVNSENCCNSIKNQSLPNNGSWKWLPDNNPNNTTYYDVFNLKYPIKKAPLGGGGSGAFSESTLTLESGNYYYNIGITSGTKTWFGPDLNINDAYVIADSGYDATKSLHKNSRDKNDPNLDLDTVSISFGGSGGKISESKGDTILAGNKGSDSYSTNVITGGTGGSPVNPIDNFNGTGGSFGGNGEPGKILLKIETSNLNTFDFCKIYYNFSSSNNDTNSSYIRGKIISTMNIPSRVNINLSNTLTKFTRFAGYTDDQYQKINDGSQKVPGTWIDPSNTEFSYVDINIKLNGIGNTGFVGKINGYISNEARINKKFSFNTLRCWIVSYNIGDNTCNC